RIRFVPRAGFTGTAGFMFRAWDQDQGTDGGILGASARGGVTPFSVPPASATILVTANHAPELGTPWFHLPGLAANDMTSNGVAVADIVAPSHITDPDPNAQQGIAVSAVDNTHGHWQFSTDGGTTWIDFGAPSIYAVRLLSDRPANR